MELTGVHVLLTYMCTLECDHCFTWGSPRNWGTMSMRGLLEFLRQARDLGSVRWVYFEGGEPFLHYPLLARGVQHAHTLGFKVGVVTNAYWATTPDDARIWLTPLTEAVSDLSVSTDPFHGEQALSRCARAAQQAAQELGIPTEFLTVSEQRAVDAPSAGALASGESDVMHRGRATEKLVHGKPLLDWRTFDGCPHEELGAPRRVHVDPFGHVHLCQGISLGNVFDTDLAEICRRYDPVAHPVIGALHSGGPAELVRRYHMTCDEGFVDACHLCYSVRAKLRQRFPKTLAPDQMYGLFAPP